MSEHATKMATPTCQEKWSPRRPNKNGYPDVRIKITDTTNNSARLPPNIGYPDVRRTRHQQRKWLPPTFAFHYATKQHIFLSPAPIFMRVSTEVVKLFDLT